MIRFVSFLTSARDFVFFFFTERSTFSVHCWVIVGSHTYTLETTAVIRKKKHFFLVVLKCILLEGSCVSSLKWNANPRLSWPKQIKIECSTYKHSHKMEIVCGFFLLKRKKRFSCCLLFLLTWANLPLNHTQKL